jgi:hypothetical protein
VRTRGTEVFGVRAPFDQRPPTISGCSPSLNRGTWSAARPPLPMGWRVSRSRPRAGALAPAAGGCAPARARV